MARQEASGDVEQTPPPTLRPMRSDAAKNRQRILEAAAEVFAAQGVVVPIDLVAERAGVGVGTLYRHFPTKEDLFVAIVATKVEDLVDAARAAAEAQDPGEAFFSFVRLLATEAGGKQDLFDALDSSGVDVKSRFADLVLALEQGVDVLVERAVACGAVRDDVRGDDVIGLVIGTCHGARRLRRDPECAQRMIGILCEGLRPAPSER